MQPDERKQILLKYMKDVFGDKVMEPLDYQELVSIFYSLIRKYKVYHFVFRTRNTKLLRWNKETLKWNQKRNQKCQEKMWEFETNRDV